MTTSELPAIGVGVPPSPAVMEEVEVSSDASSCAPSSNDTEVIDLDPSTLATQANSLLVSLEEATTKLSNLRNQGLKPTIPPRTSEPPADFDSLVSTGLSLCHALYKSYSELELLLRTYSQVWDPDDAAAEDPPYGPELEQCIRNAAFKTIALAQMPDASTPDVASDFTHTLEVANVDLGEEAERISDFLPILKADQAEYLRTTGLKVEAAPASNAEVGHRYTCPASPATAAERLRKELYLLKDSIAASMHKASNLISKLADLPAAEERSELETLQKQQGKVVNAITEALTNHDSEWIESMLSGRLTYAEFLRIDVGTVKMSTRVWDDFSRYLQNQLCAAGKAIRVKEAGETVSEIDEFQKSANPLKEGIASASDEIRSLQTLFKAKD